MWSAYVLNVITQTPPTQTDTILVSSYWLTPRFAGIDVIRVGLLLGTSEAVAAAV